MPPESEEEPRQPAGRRSRRKRKLPQTQASANSDDEESPPRKKGADVANAMLKLRLAGVETELRDTQEKYELACLEHQAIVEEKDQAIAERDSKIAELEQRLYYAEKGAMDQVYFGHPPHFYYAEEMFGREDVLQQEAPRLLSRRGR